MATFTTVYRHTLPVSDQVEDVGRGLAETIEIENVWNRHNHPNSPNGRTRQALALQSLRWRANPPSMDPLVYDYDPSATLTTYQRESDGAWLVVGDPIAEGIAVYDGVRELITPEAVAAYLPHIARLVVTMGHPTDEVTPDTVGALQVGDVDSDPKIVTLPGGWTAVRAHHTLRRRDATDAAEQRALKGLSLGHRPIRDNVSGTHPLFGAYDRRRIGVLDVNHVALCGDSDSLPPPRIANCALYLDSRPVVPAKVKPMTPEERAAKARDAWKALALCTDAVSYDKAVAMLKELAADPDGLLLIKAYAEKGGKEEKPKEEAKGAEAPPMDPAAMDAAIKRATDALEARLRPELDAARKEREARDAQSAADKSTRDAQALTDARTLARKHGLATADSADRAACSAHLRTKLDLDAHTSDDAVLAVARYASTIRHELPFSAHDAASNTFSTAGIG